MKISLQWLSDFLPGAIDADDAADALMRGGLPVESIERVNDDAVLDVEVTSNRGDCLSHVGIARELSALLDRESRELTTAVTEASTPATEATSVRIDALDLCPLYTARIIRNVKVGPSPQWMVKRLEAVGLRSINNIVDATNYVMFEMGQPLHAFDFDKLDGRQIIVRTARAGERIVSIDGHERVLNPSMLVIADAQRPVALAGVMGGLNSEVAQTTTNVLLESARFDPLSVRRTARALAMTSDSSYRFERGIDPTLAERASLRVALLIVETAGGELLRGMAFAGETKYSPRQLSLRVNQLQRILGIEPNVEQALGALRRLQLCPELHDDRVTVRVPTWRLDLSIEADLIEEIARVLGYDRIPVRDEISIRLTPPEPEAHAMDTIRSTLVSAGFFESITFTFVSDALADDFRPADARALPRADAKVRKADAHLRPSILPGLLEALRRNETVGTLNARLFEIGATFFVDATGNVREERRLGIVGDEDYHALRGAVALLLEKLDPQRDVRIVPDSRAGYSQGACGRIEWGGQAIGYIGQVDARVVNKLSLRARPMIAELEAEALVAGHRPVRQLRALAKFPAVRRDISLVVLEQVRYDAIETLIRKLDLPFLEAVDYVVTYRGKPLEKGVKSVTVTLAFRSPTATLTSEQVEQSVRRVIETAQRELAATLRT